jgi:hypothetical protein
MGRPTWVLPTGRAAMPSLPGPEVKTLTPGLTVRVVGRVPGPAPGTWATLLRADAPPGAAVVWYLRQSVGEPPAWACYPRPGEMAVFGRCVVEVSLVRGDGPRSGPVKL